MTAIQQPVRLRTAAGCSLAIGAYPRFRYDARGGGGLGVLHPSDSQGRRHLHFPPDQLVIPPLNRRTGRWLGLPLPAGLEVRILPSKLEGWLEPASGAVQLHFQARFVFSAASIYQAPPLWVDTLLTSAAPEQPVPLRWGQPVGEARRGDGGLTLVGVAPVAPSGDRWFDRLMGLPSEALAQLRCSLSWES
jgi:hypothetical protein